MKRKKYANHKAIVAEAQVAAGEWVYATTYPSTDTARSIASSITRPGKNHLTAYEPVGAYEAETRMVDDGTDVWVKYVGVPAEAVSTP